MSRLIVLAVGVMTVLPVWAGGGTHFVDMDNNSGIVLGTALRPYFSIQDAIDAASSGDTVLVAQGVYTENVTISDKQITLRGGYEGGSPLSYTGGLGGDFATQDITGNVTTITAQSTDAATVLLILAADGSTIDGFTITGGLHGIEVDTAFTFPHIGNVTISNNIIRTNGVSQDVGHRGGGILLSGDGHTITGNSIRENLSGRGAGIILFGDNVTFSNNVVENNIGYDDHGGGIYQAGNNTVIEGCLVRGNRAGEELGYGWGGGVLILGNATIRDSVITGNTAPSIGGGIFVDEGGDAIMENLVVAGNSGNGIYVDGGEPGPSTAQIRNCTIADNTDADEAGVAIVVEGASSVTVVDSIIWGNGVDDFTLIDTSTLAVTFSITQEAILGAGNLSVDPQFAGGGDYHLKSTAGRFDPAANGGAGGFVLDATDSPAIDAGNPASAFANEPEPNGGRVNMGAYGNTAEASKTPGGPVEGEGDGGVEGEGEGDGTADQELDVDTDSSGSISLQELLLLIQFYNSGTYHCDNGDPSGYAAGNGPTGCGPMNSDYLAPTFSISLSEVLRLIQFYNSGGYFACEAGEDGFCAGVEP